ncbi:MAG: LytR cell envelope-related transcriptional attenuator [Actinomycetia bacterium]|nr:LytR cell envelope-related transcriptional attenuator [Actinomycetes bacterium]
MSRQGGNRDNGDVARGASVAAAKGAGLVLLAIIIGIVLLQVVDDGRTPAGTAQTHKTTTTTHKPATTTKTTKPTTSTTKAPARAVKSPDQVRVIVLNAGAPTGSANTVSQALRAKGYTNQQPPNNWANANQKGTSVLCRPGSEQEGAALAIAVGNGATVKPFPNPPPPSSGNVDCVVAVGHA